MRFELNEDDLNEIDMRLLPVAPDEGPQGARNALGEINSFFMNIASLRILGKRLRPTGI